MSGIAWVRSLTYACENSRTDICAHCCWTCDSLATFNGECIAWWWVVVVIGGDSGLRMGAPEGRGPVETRGPFQQRRITGLLYC